jgi:hypothetical protein
MHCGFEKKYTFATAGDIWRSCCCTGRGVTVFVCRCSDAQFCYSIGYLSACTRVRVLAQNFVEYFPFSANSMIPSPPPQAAAVIFQHSLL